MQISNQNKDMYDIIIENATKEWFNMNPNLQNPNW